MALMDSLTNRGITKTTEVVSSHNSITSEEMFIIFGIIISGLLIVGMIWLFLQLNNLIEIKKEYYKRKRLENEK